MKLGNVFFLFVVYSFSSFIVAEDLKKPGPIGSKELDQELSRESDVPYYKTWMLGDHFRYHVLKGNHEEVKSLLGSLEDLSKIKYRYVEKAYESGTTTRTWGSTTAIQLGISSGNPEMLRLLVEATQAKLGTRETLKQIEKEIDNAFMHVSYHRGNICTYEGQKIPASEVDEEWERHYNRRLEHKIAKAQAGVDENGAKYQLLLTAKASLGRAAADAMPRLRSGPGLSHQRN